MIEYHSPAIDLDPRVWRVLDLIVAEFASDPMSVQCFDLRTVEEAKAVIAERKRLERRGDVPPLLTTGRDSDTRPKAGDKGTLGSTRE